MICLELNLIIYDLSRKLQLCKFVWTPVCSSVWVVFNNFLLKDLTDRSKIRSKHYRIFVDVSLYHLSLFANTLFKESNLHIKLFVLFSWLYMLVKLIFTFKYSQANLFLVQITKFIGVPINMRIDWRHFIKYQTVGTFLWITTHVYVFPINDVRAEPNRSTIIFQDKNRKKRNVFLISNYSSCNFHRYP